ncbi:hypothetical protein [Saccharibacillus alkalitolerans]|uniref:Lipoprotein n=1 Tax=Saccharibacillus alkalitolerans TaxID=2705290 RepID=A0ABX0FBF2_9BACL|nr:hypothetical protein [Saccharibacillus alkalitolerans]NGZ77389.1 hypothetical protein [Saccharibacillus alkalitolerans]
MKLSGKSRFLRAALASAALLAVLGACSGESAKTANGGGTGAETPRPIESDGSGTAETTRPDGGTATEQPREDGGRTAPAEAESGGAARAEQRRPDGGTPPAEAESGGAARTEQRRPDGGTPPAEAESGGAARAEQRRPDDGTPSAEPESGGAARAEQRRPDGGTPPAEAESGGAARAEERRPDGGTPPVEAESGGAARAEERSRPQESKRPQSGEQAQEQAPQDAPSGAAKERQRPEGEGGGQTKKDAGSLSEQSRTNKGNPAKDRSTADERQRPTAPPKWTGPNGTAEMSRSGSSFPGSGQYLIHTHIRPGLYRSVGTIEYWERDSGLSGTAKDRIAGGSPKGPAVVEIKSTDAGFVSKGSGCWQAVSAGKSVSPKTKFGAGTYIVGVDIAPGRYRSSGGADFWAALSGFGGEHSDILRSASPGGSSPVTVDIKATDKGFTSTGALWTKIN